MPSFTTVVRSIESTIIPGLQMENCTAQKSDLLKEIRKPVMEEETEFKLCRTVQITGPVFLADGDNNNFFPCKFHL